MSKSTLAIIIYIAGLIFGALVLDIWSAETGPKLYWDWLDSILLVALFYADKNEKK